MPDGAGAAAIPIGLELVVPALPLYPLAAVAVVGVVGYEAYAGWIADQQIGNRLKRLNAQISATKAAINALAMEQVQLQARMSKLDATALAVRLQMDLNNRMIADISAIQRIKFTSRVDADDWFQSVVLSYSNGLIDSSTLAIAQNYYTSELARLAAAAAPAPAAPVATVTAPAAAGSTPLYHVGDILQTSDGKQWKIQVVIPGDPPWYTTLRLDNNNVSNIPETAFTATGAVVISAGAPAETQPVSPSATTTTPGAPTAPAGTVPGVTVNFPDIAIPTAGEMRGALDGMTVKTPDISVPSAGELAGTLGLVLPMAGTAAISALLAGALTLGEGMHSGSLRSQLTAGQRMAGLLTDVAAPLATMAVAEIPAIRDKITSPITKWMFDELLTMPERSRPIRPEDSPDLARSLLERTIGLGIAAHAASVAAELSTPLKNMGLGYLSAFMADMAGFGRIAGATMGVLETRALAVPMGYYVNSKVRTSIPGVGDLGKMAGEYELVPEERRRTLAATDQGLDEIDLQNRNAYFQWAKYHGFTDMWLSLMYDSSHHPAGERLLRSMADQGIWDEPYYRAALMHTGYDVPTVRKSMEMLNRRAHGELRVIGVSTVVQRYKVGLDDEAEFADNLREIGVSDIMLPKYQHMAQLEADYDDYADYLASLKDLVAKGAIEPDAMEQLLIERGVRPDKAKLKAQREAIKLLPKVKKTPAAASG